MQYTLRDVPQALDAELRRRAKRDGKSLNEVTLETLARGAGLTREAVRYRTLSDLAGTWKEDPEFDEAVAEQHAVDRDLWK
jgi:hypothetical protein